MLHLQAWANLYLSGHFNTMKGEHLFHQSLQATVATSIY